MLRCCGLCFFYECLCLVTSDIWLYNNRLWFSNDTQKLFHTGFFQSQYIGIIATSSKRSSDDKLLGNFCSVDLNSTESCIHRWTDQIWYCCSILPFPLLSVQRLGYIGAESDILMKSLVLWQVWKTMNVQQCATYYHPWHTLYFLCQWKSLEFPKTLRFVTVLYSFIVPVNATLVALEITPHPKRSTLLSGTIECSWYHSWFYTIIINDFDLETSSVFLPLRIFLTCCGSSRSYEKSDIALSWHPLPPHKREIIPTSRRNYFVVYMIKEETIYVYIFGLYSLY